MNWRLGILFALVFLGVIVIMRKRPPSDDK